MAQPWRGEYFLFILLLLLYLIIRLQLNYLDVLKTFQHFYLVGFVLVIYLVKMLNKLMDQIKLVCVLDMHVYQVVIFVVYFINHDEKNFVRHIILLNNQVIFLQHVVLVFVLIVKKQGKCKCEVCLMTVNFDVFFCQSHLFFRCTTWYAYSGRFSTSIKKNLCS